MKLIGAILCIAAFLLSGTVSLENEKRKAEAYGGLSAAFTNMKNELCAKLLPLTELTARAEESSEGCVKQLFKRVLRGFDEIGEKDFSVIWNEAVRESFPFFTQEQRRALCQPGAVLGQSAGETQRDCLENTAAFFKAEEMKMKESLPGTEKLALGLSACAGFLTVIALY